MAPRPQKGKNRKRPRAWHRGRAAGRLQVVPLARIERAEARASELEVELQEAARSDREETELWQSLEHVSPFVPRWL